MMLLSALITGSCLAAVQWPNVPHQMPQQMTEPVRQNQFDAGMSSMNSIIEALEKLPKQEENIRVNHPRYVVPVVQPIQPIQTVQPTVTEMVQPSFDNQRFVQLAKLLIQHLHGMYKKLQEEATALEMQKKQVQAQIQVLNNNAMAESLRLEQLRRQYALMEQQLQEKLNEVQKARQQLEAERLNANLPTTSTF